MPAPLRLEVADFTDADHWRWVLKDAGGAFLADHSVALDRSDRSYQGMVDLPGYLRRQAVPDRRDADEKRLIAEVGAWMGTQVVGRAIAEKLLARAHPVVVVRVLLPPQAERLLTLPLEIACLDGRTLSVAGVNFVMETTGAQPLAVDPVGDRLRMLALFSLPAGGSPLNLRRERQKLRQVVDRLVQTRGHAIDLRILQYGVTRAGLTKVLEENEGWDIIHFSGHGLPGSLVLEKPDGSADHLPSAALVELLRQAGQRLKLVVLSSCLSAAASIDQTLTWLGLSPEAAPRREAAPAAGSSAAAPTVARALTQVLGCAVLAMRYSVEDEFAMWLGAHLYESLLESGQPLPEALRLARAKTVGAATYGALSVAAPALFGAKAATLGLAPPEGDDKARPASLLANFRDQPLYFVGRVAAMTRASTALAANSMRSSVLFQGMAGAGKTSCAVELAYHHESARRFRRFVWYEAPKQDADLGATLRDFALAMERDAKFEMVHVVANEDHFRAWLPKLRSLLANNAVLIVLDNMETLLTETGQWRDPMWGLLIEALLAPGGLSRTVLTSRIRPAKLPPETEVISVHALPRDEALLLVRELPNLRRLLDGAAPGVPGPQEGRDLVRRTLRLVQGHPELIKLAEAQAADPAGLTAHLQAADAAQTQGAAELDAFFRDGDSRLRDTAFMAELRGWTRGIAAALPEAARLCFHFLCLIEEGDRESWIIAMNWNDVWQRLGRTAPAPDSAPLLASLVAAALVDRQTVGEGAEAYRVVIHPGVAEAGKAEAGTDVQAAVDSELAATWIQLMRQALATQGKEAWAHGAIVRAGQSGFPYLSRLGEWDLASGMVEQVHRRDRSPGTIAAILPAARRIAEATAGTDRGLTDRAVLAAILRSAGRIREAEEILRDVVAAAEKSGDFALASGASVDLANLLRDQGQLQGALVLQKKAILTRHAGRGPWSQLSDEVAELQIRAAMGQHEAVLTRVLALRLQMAEMPDPPEANDQSVNIWNVREALLDTGHTAALATEQWQQALDLSGDIQQSQVQRGAGRLERTRNAFNDYGPLLSLERYHDAGQLLDVCRNVFESENAVEQMGNVLSAQAALSSRLGDFEAAKNFERSALRYTYARGTPTDAAISHFNLSNYLRRLDPNWSDILSHRLAAVLIAIVTGDGKAGQIFQAFSQDLSQAGDMAESALPVDFAALCATVETVEGVRFRALMADLEPDEAALTARLHDIIAKAREAA